ncbi:NYN domain-containing protein [Microlunatus sp. GCM10028923]|uniref:NYN domain-containing protein n=1 Tax=Microlunatus sp. GCM10028923 TaxID=3273400 RepID=UPI0036213DD1
MAEPEQIETPPARTILYVDGFNLYYRLRKTPYKWLDLGAVFCRLLHDHDIVGIRYCTARVKELPDNPGVSARQEAYLAALRSVPGLTIHYGKFRADKKKGSDVNLATRMLVDAFDQACDVSVLVSNDSDLVLPFSLLGSRFGQTTGLVNPWDAPLNRELLTARPAIIRRLRDGLPAVSQFDSPLTVGNRTLHRPASWPAPPKPRPRYKKAETPP